mmetsp:Transcript_20120/g.41711  ORF Transcript_20120/g.41711 Transcript_20120/m.41711 type:complete len:207 (-) Transcript_20120:187-807(-)
MQRHHLHLRHLITPRDRRDKVRKPVIDHLLCREVMDEVRTNEEAEGDPKGCRKVCLATLLWNIEVRILAPEILLVILCEEGAISVERHSRVELQAPINAACTRRALPGPAIDNIAHGGNNCNPICLRTAAECDDCGCTRVAHRVVAWDITMRVWYLLQQGQVSIPGARGKSGQAILRQYYDLSSSQCCVARVIHRHLRIFPQPLRT